MRSVTMPSGATLEVHAAPFVDSKRLFQAMMAEMQTIKLDKNAELSSLLKDLFCIGYSSPLIEARLEKCMERCLYNGVKITAESFESETARNDYMTVCAEVATENVAPFLKSLIAKFREYTTTINNIQASL